MLFKVFKYASIYEQVKLSFVGESKDCDEIFEGFDSPVEECFAEVTSNSVKCKRCKKKIDFWTFAKSSYCNISWQWSHKYHNVWE